MLVANFIPSSTQLALSPLPAISTESGLGVIGLVLILGTLLVGARAGIVASPEVADDQDAPWRHRRWRGGDLSSSRGHLWARWGFALLWNLVSLPLFFVIPEALESGNKAALIGVLFPAVGMILLGSAVRKTLKALRFGRSTFRMASFPGVPGGRVAGEIELPEGSPEADWAKITLSCMRSVIVRDTENNRRVERPEWEQFVEFDLALLSSYQFERRISVAFDLPDDALTTSLDRHADPRFSWQLKVELTSSLNPDHEVKFEVPVFDTDRVESRFEIQLNQPTDPQESETWQQALTRAGFQLDFVGPDRLTVVGGPFRKIGRSLSSLTSAAAMFLTVYFLVWADIPVLFVIPCAFVGFILLLFGLDLLLLHEKFVVSGRRLTATRKRISTRTRELELDSVSRFEVRQYMTVGNSIYFELIAHLNPKPRSRTRFVLLQQLPEKAAVGLKSCLDGQLEL